MPPSITQEEPANNLASLTMSDSLRQLIAELIHQWDCAPAFRPLKQYGIGPINRALFYGPPGNGKTVASQLIASKIGCPLYRVRSEGLLTGLLGGSERNIAEVMDWIEQAGKCVVLFDECETLFPDRSVAIAESTASSRIGVMQIFWQRLDRWKTPQLFLLATNLVDRLDSALLSRMEMKLEFGPPTQQQSLDVLAYWTEVFHAYGSAEWSVPLREAIEDDQLPASFRALWQQIAFSVRQHICSGGTADSNTPVA